jgi:hypothetical protein
MKAILPTPTAKPSTSLAAVASSVRHVQPYVGPCQLPVAIAVPGKRSIRKPAGW